MYNPKPYSINYIKHWDNNGTVYDQTINLPVTIWKKLKDILKARINTLAGEDYYFQLYLSRQIIRKGTLIFVNLTQIKFLNKYLKLKLKNRNTCFNLI